MKIHTLLSNAAECDVEIYKSYNIHGAIDILKVPDYTYFRF